MSAEWWNIISIVGFSLGGVAFITAIVIFFKMKIPSVISDLNGKKVNLEIREIHNQSAALGDMRFGAIAFKPRAISYSVQTVDKPIVFSNKTELLSETNPDYVTEQESMPEHKEEKNYSANEVNSHSDVAVTTFFKVTRTVVEIHSDVEI